jgi:hypothetical protein
MKQVYGRLRSENYILTVIVLKTVQEPKDGIESNGFQHTHFWRRKLVLNPLDYVIWNVDYQLHRTIFLTTYIYC